MHPFFATEVSNLSSSAEQPAPLGGEGSAVQPALHDEGGSAEQPVPTISQQLALTDEMSACSSAEKPVLLSHSVAQPVGSSLLAEVRKLGQHSSRRLQINGGILSLRRDNLWTALDATSTTDQFPPAAVATHRIH